MMIDFAVRLLEGWKQLLDAIEDVLVDAVAATVPWLAPVIPAAMTWQHVQALFGWEPWLAWLTAATIEGLGLSAVSTSYALWRYNSQYKSRSAGPFWLSVGTGVFYLGVVLTVNVVLDVYPEERWALVTAKVLLSTLSVIAMVILALRAGYARQLADDRERKSARRGGQKRGQLGGSSRGAAGQLAGGNSAKSGQMGGFGRSGGQLAADVSGGNGGSGGQFGGQLAALAARYPAADWRPLKRALTAEEKRLIADASVDAIVQAWGVSRKTARRWKDKAAGGEQ